MYIAFDNSYARLPDRFYARQDPVPVAAPRLLKLNQRLASELGLDADWLASADGVAVLAGNKIAEGSMPITQAYAGHQFGHFTPQLGDGRANLLGEVIGRDGIRRDIQLKGAGRTRWSRGGDGRAAVGPVLREYIISEAMFALGIPTTLSLAAVATGESVYREIPLPGAVLTRVAASHIRVGTFQYFAARGDTEGVRLLADHAIARHYPQVRSYRDFLAAVVAAQADLVARWLLVGFIHGVMNTDNCSIAGETIDYGPCAFMEAYDAGTVFSSIDEYGRYAYGNQPRITLWNLTRLAETLLPLLDDDQDKAVAQAQDVLAGFGPAFEAVYLPGLRRKIGLDGNQDGDDSLVRDLLALMAENRADFTATFRGLADPSFDAGPAFADWTARWRQRRSNGPALDDAAMRALNPVYIPRNHLVEEALKAAEAGNLAPFESLLAVIACPFEERPGRERYAAPAKEHERVLQTFCGT